MSAPIQHFESLSTIPHLKHGFLLRVPGVDVATLDKPEALRRLQIHHDESRAELGMADWPLISGEQVHSAEVLAIHRKDIADLSWNSIPGVDGFITDQDEVTLAIYVADCGAVFLADPVSRAIGVLHSGKNGTSAGITTNAIRMMGEQFGTKPENLHLALAPCIRPPAYEVDFAAEILSQALKSGVPESQIDDCGICTSSDLDRFYSYRVEKGKTGRMLALIGWEPTC